jgi:hypothetical protein
MTYCSLGGLCHSAQLLKINGLKKASYPFDWIFSSLQMVEHCIKDDFKTFLDKTQYIDYTTNSTLKETQCEHTFYGKMLADPEHNIIFNHHNPLSNESDYAYFERCVNRFRDLVKSNEYKGFVLFDTNDDFKNNTKKYYNFSDFLNEHKIKHKLFVINNKVSRYQDHEWVIANNLRLIRLQTNSSTNGLVFNDKSDEDYLNKLIQKWEFM